MPITQLSLAVVGVDYPNKRGPARRFELELCEPGEPVHLVPEPGNPADPRAVAVFSARGVQIGYLTAERCGWIGSVLRSGRDVAAAYQGRTKHGAVIRVAFDGEEPKLPDPPPSSNRAASRGEDWWPDEIPPDDF